MAAPCSIRVIAAVVFAVIAIVLGNLYTIKNADKETRAIIFRFEFVMVLETLIFVGARYIWRNTNRALGPQPVSNPQAGSKANGNGMSPLVHRAMRMVTFAYLSVVQCSYLSTVFSVGDEPSFIGMSCFIALGIFIQLVISIFCLNRVFWLWSFIKRRRTLGDISKRRKASMSVTLALIYALSVVTYGVHFAAQPPIVKYVEIPVDKLPSSMDGFRIVLVSDVHLGATVGKSKLARIVDMVNKLEPDAVAMVGDFVDAPVSKLAGAAEPIRNLKAKKGKFFVTGNHEYHTGNVDGWFEHWRSLGVTVLHNQHAQVHSDTDPAAFFYMAGVDDLEAEKLRYDGHGMRLDDAVGGCDKDRAIVLLAHQPWAAKRALDSKYNIQLVLSGHTHGGQMFPIMLGAYLLNPFFAGLYNYQGSHVYVSQGAVYWGIPVRIGTQHELSMITLRAQQHPESSV